MKEQNMIRQFLRSEITWTISIIIAVFAFITTVVLPIQALQINVTKIQQQLDSESARYISITQQNDIRFGILERNQAVVMAQLKINKQ